MIQHFSRIVYLTDTKICVIGARWFSMIVMLAVEMLAQLYLTLRFLWPVVQIHRDGNGLLLPLRTVMIRMVIGCAITLLGDLGANVPPSLFHGVPAWLCFINCKVEAFLAISVLHWITSPILTDKKHGQDQHELGVGFQESTRPSENAALQSGAESAKHLYIKEVLAHPTCVLQVGHTGCTSSHAATAIANAVGIDKV